jgi:hypothetical protein
MTDGRARGLVAAVDPLDDTEEAKRSLIRRGYELTDRELAANDKAVA